MTTVPTARETPSPSPPASAPGPSHRRLGWVGLLAAAAACLLPAAGAPGQDAQPAAPPVPAVAPPVPVPPPAGGALQQKIAEIEAAQELDPTLKAKLLEIYRQAKALEAEGVAFKERAAVFRGAVSTAPAEAAALRARLNAPPPPPKTPPAAAPADQIAQELGEAQAQLAALKTRLADWDRRVKEALDRPEPARGRLAEAKALLTEIEAGLAAAPSAEESPLLREARRTFLETRKQVRSAEVDLLEQELLSNPARQELASAQRDTSAREIAATEQYIKRLEEEMSRARQAEAARAREEAARLSREAAGKHPLVQAEAARLADVTREIETLGPLLDRAKADRAAAEERLTQVSADFDEAVESLKWGLSDSLAVILRDRRETLPDLRRFERSAASRAARISEVRLRLLQLDRELKELGDPAQVAAARAATAAGAVDRETLEAELLPILGKLREQIARLASTYRASLTELGNLEAKQKELVGKAGEFATFLDGRLLWIRSHPPVGAETGGTFAAGAGRFLSADNLTAAAAHFGEVVFSRRPVLPAFVILLTLFVLFSRKRLVGQLAEMAPKVGKVRTDHFGLTVRALYITALLAAPIPAITAYLGWELTSAPALPDVVKAAGHGLLAAAAAAAVLTFLDGLCAARGLAELHFKWAPRITAMLRRTVRVSGPFLALAFIVLGATEWLRDEALRQGVGRVTFILIMVVTGGIAHYLLRPARGLSAAAAPPAGPPGDPAPASLRARSAKLWHFLGIVLPLGLALAAAAGYTYTALELAQRLLWTVLLLAAALLVRDLVYRWLVISQRKLALRVALEKRQAQTAARAAARAADGAAPEEVEETRVDLADTVDVAEIRAQTGKLLRASFWAVVVIGLWLIWAGVLPALRVLDDVSLWYRTVVSDGGEQRVPVTLADLFLALFIAVATVVGSKNLPGALEIAILQRLSLDAGSRYATRAICNYLIVAIGVVMAFNAIGVGWSSVQWLVAALTVGLGFGLQEIFANFVSGIIILVERPVRVGDTVTVGSISGIVTKIRMRATTITDWNRKELIVPNKTFITSELVNWTLSDPILRLDFTVGVAYGSDTTLAHRVMLQVAREHPAVLKQPEPNVFFLGFGDNSLNFEVRAFVSEMTNTGRTRILHDLHMAVDRACREHQIEIAFPQRDLHLRTADAVIKIARADDPAPGPDPGAGAPPPGDQAGAEARDEPAPAPAPAESEEAWRGERR